MFERVIRYRMLKRLGAGGMGEVFLAEDRSLERRVAIKFVSRWLQDDPVAHERLTREVKAAAALDHPYICKLYEITQVVGWRGMARWCVGDAESVDEAREAEAIAERIGGLGAVAVIRMARAMNRLSRQGDLDALEAFARWFIDFSVRSDFPWKMVGASWLGLASFWRGQRDVARSHVARSLEFERQMRHPQTAWSIWSNAVMVKAYTGDGDVGVLLDERASFLPQAGSRNSNGAWGLLLKTVEARVLLGQADAAASLYPLVLEALDTGTVTEFQTMELLQTGARDRSGGRRPVGGG